MNDGYTWGRWDRIRVREGDGAPWGDWAHEGQGSGGHMCCVQTEDTSGIPFKQPRPVWLGAGLQDRD